MNSYPSQVPWDSYSYTNVPVPGLKREPSVDNDDTLINSWIASPSPISTAIPTNHTARDDVHTDKLSNIPTPLKQPRLPQRSSLLTGSKDFESKRIVHEDGQESVPFRPEGDVPKTRFHSVNFNFMRRTADYTKRIAETSVGAVNSNNLSSYDGSSEPKKDPIIGQETFSARPMSTGDHIEGVMEPDVSQKNAQPCSDCRKRHKRCTHTSRNPQRSKPAASRTKAANTVLSTEAETAFPNRIKKDGTPYRIVPHDRAKGPSMSKQAVDYRQRKIIQQQYQDQLVALIDDSIVKEVEDEGGITPLGRVFKAAVRMLERAQNERI